MSSAGASVKFKYLHSLDTTFSLILVLVLSVNQHLLTVRVFFRHQGKPGETWQQWILIWGGIFCFFSLLLMDISLYSGYQISVSRPNTDLESQILFPFCSLSLPKSFSFQFAKPPGTLRLEITFCGTSYRPISVLI